MLYLMLFIVFQCYKWSIDSKLQGNNILKNGQPSWNKMKSTVELHGMTLVL